jgi:hypothetical protein
MRALETLVSAGRFLLLVQRPGAPFRVLRPRTRQGVQDPDGDGRAEGVIHAPELLRELGVPDSAEFAVAARCDAEFGARVWPSLAADLQSTFSRFERDGR